MCSNNNGFHKSWSFFLLLTGLKESEGSNLDPKNQLFHEWNFWGVVISTRLPSNVGKKFWKIVFFLEKEATFFKIVKRECSFKLETFFMATIIRLHIYRDLRTKAIFPHSILTMSALTPEIDWARPYKGMRVFGLEPGSSWAVNNKSWRILLYGENFSVDFSVIFS